MAIDINGYNDTFRAFADFANNATREMFRNAVIDMFGGESKIPE